MSAYYNENDAYAAQWLRNLIAAGHIAPGEVDERSIVAVRADDLRGFTQCHFFAGIGVWSHALRLAGWPDDEPVWTGSCPCQPFSAAGARGGAEDARHLWPAWFPLIRDCRPDRVFGEQVASSLGRAWLVAVRADLESLGYALGRRDTCAAGVGAPHIRQRLYFVAESSGARVRDQGRGSDARAARVGESEVHQRERLRDDAGDDCGSGCAVAHADGRDASAEGLQRGGEHGQQQEDGGTGGGLGDAHREGHEEQRSERGVSRITPCANEGKDADRASRLGDSGRAGSSELGRQRDEPSRSATTGFWSGCDWLPCIDGKARPVEPGTFPLAHGAPARVGRLRAYGNAIVAPVAAEFIRAYRSAMP